VRTSAMLGLLLLASTLSPVFLRAQNFRWGTLPPGDYPSGVRAQTLPVSPNLTFHTGDLIDVVSYGGLGLLVLPGNFAMWPTFCKPFMYDNPQQCGGYIVLSGDLGNSGANPASECNGTNDYVIGPQQFQTSYSTPGIYKLTATLFACQALGSINPFTGDYYYAPTNTLLATITYNLTILPPNAGSPADMGPCESDTCEAQAGSPINVMTGDVSIQHADYALPGLGGGMHLLRTWNSEWQQINPFTVAGMFGNNWQSNYEEHLTSPNPSIVTYWRGDGNVWTFSLNSTAQSYSVTSPPNQYATLTLNSNTGQYVIVFADGTQKTFDQNGFLLALLDRNGNQTALTYDQASRLIQVTDPGGRSISFSYSDPSNSGQATSVQDAFGVVATYLYDSDSRLTTVTYADGSTLNFTYDPNTSMILSVTDAQGKVLEEHTYDSILRGLTSARANGVDALSVSYNNVSGISTLTDSLGNTTQYPNESIGGRHFVDSVQGTGCSSCGARGTAYFSHDGRGNRTSSTDALGLNTSYTYDLLGNVLTKFTSVCSGGGGFAWNFTPTNLFDEFRPEADFPEFALPDPNPQSGCLYLTWTYTYNSFQEMLTATDPAGNVTTNTYDANGNLLSTTTPSLDGSNPGSTTTFAYDSKGELITVTDPRGNTTNMGYTPAGLIASTTDAQNHSTTFVYDARGNRTSVTDPLGSITTFTYDVMNRLTLTTQPGSVATAIGYDYRGRRISVTDPNSKTTGYAYDDADRMVSVRDAAGNATAYVYDTENNLTTITDAAGHATSFSYNAQGHAVSASFPGGTETYSYDSLGNLLSKIDRNGNTISYSYDGIYRLTSKNYPNSTSVNYAYDILSRLTQVVDPSGTYNFTYDNMGRLTQSSTQYSFLSGQTLVNNYTYDAASNRMSFANPQGGTTSYIYDSLNHLTSETDFAGRLFTFSYDALGRRTALTRPNGVNTSYTYDPLSRLLSVLHQAGSSTLDGTDYAYDVAGNRTSKTALPSNVTSSYTYDPAYMLTKVMQGATQMEGYTYDAVGNRTYQPGAPYTYNSSNEMLTREGVPYTYDANGNTLSKTNKSGATSYAWDFENRLTGVTLPTGGVVSFKYDPFGRRIQKSAAAGTTTYVYDGDNIEEELNGASGTLGERYTYGPGVDEPLVGQRQPQIYYYEADGLGSVTSLTDPTGAIAATYTYDSFGFQTKGTGNATNWFRYTGRDLDSDTGLYYYRARYYDPMTGRFLSEDPIGFGGGVNKYAYARNDPSTRNDPQGLCDDQKCAQGLNDANKDMKAIDRANAAWDTIQAAADANDIDPALLAAVGVLESGFRNVNERGGANVGVGVFQLTVAPGSGVTAAQAGDLTWAGNYAANMLNSNTNYLAGKFPNFTPTQLLQATAASYNFGTKNISGNPNTIDVGSKPNNNYGALVLQLMNCF
jgi:RHS repeat-associated protein